MQPNHRLLVRVGDRTFLHSAEQAQQRVDHEEPEDPESEEPGERNRSKKLQHARLPSQLRCHPRCCPVRPQHGIRVALHLTTSLGRHSGRPTHSSPTRRGPRVPDRHVRGVAIAPKLPYARSGPPENPDTLTGCSPQPAQPCTSTGRRLTQETIAIHPRNEMTYAPGDRVMHSQYGDGTLVSTNEYHTIIDFDEHGRRTFSSPRVVLSASSTPAP